MFDKTLRCRLARLLTVLATGGGGGGGQEPMSDGVS